MKLRKYQREGNERIKAQWSAGHTHVLAVAPTGAGKTEMAGALIKDAVAGGGRSLFVVHLREIVLQTADRLRTHFGLRVGVIMAGQPRDEKADVQVASVQTLVGEWAFRYDLVVIDECHHYRDNTWREAIAATGCARVVGFTATPERGDGAPLGDLFTSLVQVTNYQPLLTAKPPRLVPSRVFCAAELHDGNLSMEPSAAYLAYASGRSAFIYTHSVAEAYAVRDRLASAGVSAEAVADETPKDARDALVERFKRGDVAVIVNFGTMIEGVDAPACNAVVIGRVCAHRSLYLQMCGRAMRPADGKADALVLDLVGASLSHGAPTIDRDWWLHEDERVSGSLTFAPAPPERREPSVHGWKLREWTATELEEFAKTSRTRSAEELLSERAKDAAESVVRGERNRKDACAFYGVNFRRLARALLAMGHGPVRSNVPRAERISSAVAAVVSGAGIVASARRYKCGHDDLAAALKAVGAYGTTLQGGAAAKMERAVAMVSDGSTIQAAAEACRVGHRHLRARLAQQSIVPTRSLRASAERLEQAALLLAKGKSAKQAALATGATLDYVRNKAREMGLAKPPEGSPDERARRTFERVIAGEPLYSARHAERSDPAKVHALLREHGYEAGRGRRFQKSHLAGAQQ